MNVRYQYHYIRGLLKRYGFWGLVLKTAERRQSPMLGYTSCYKRYLPAPAELLRQERTPLPFAPLVSIVVPLYETPREYLWALMDCVCAQTYPNWELCLADGSRTGRAGKAVEEYASTDSRIRYVRLTRNGGISGNTNSGLKMARGSYIALMDHDDLIPRNALYEMVACLNKAYQKDERDRALIYSDEDKIDSSGFVHSRPHFKPDFNPEFLRRNNYFCHFLLFSSKLSERVGGFLKEYDGAQDYDFVLRCVDAGAVVRHVPKILYHWRIHEGSTAGSSGDKEYAFDSGCRAIEAHLKRNGEPGRASVTENLGVYRIAYTLTGSHTVTVAAADPGQLLQLWRHYGSQVSADGGYRLKIQYLHAENPDFGIESAVRGDYILYIAEHIKVKPEGLIESLLGICRQERNGIVAAKLVTKKKRVASCGYFYDSRGRLVPACGGIPSVYRGYFLHAAIPQNVSAASLACSMIKREALERAGGFASGLHGIYRDADLCFRMAEQGFAVVATPEVTAVIGGLGRTEGVWEPEKERQRFFEKWKTRLAQPDPCYNRNLSLEPGHTYAMKGRPEG